MQSLSHASISLYLDSEVLRNPFQAILPPLGTSEKKPTTAVILLQKDKKERRFNEQPTHKTTHLQTAPADTKPKFAKELFSCQRTNHEMI